VGAYSVSQELFSLCALTVRRRLDFCPDTDTDTARTHPPHPPLSGSFIPLYHGPQTHTWGGGESGGECA